MLLVLDSRVTHDPRESARALRVAQKCLARIAIGQPKGEACDITEYDTQTTCTTTHYTTHAHAYTNKAN